MHGGPLITHPLSETKDMAQAAVDAAKTKEFAALSFYIDNYLQNILPSIHSIMHFVLVCAETPHQLNDLNSEKALEFIRKFLNEHFHYLPDDPELFFRLIYCLADDEKYFLQNALLIRRIIINKNEILTREALLFTLEWATQNVNLPLVEALLPCFVPIWQSKTKAFILAMDRWQAEEILDLLLLHQDRFSKTVIEEAFIYAAAQGYSLNIERFLERTRVGKNKTVICEALKQAASNSHMPVVVTLFERIDLSSAEKQAVFNCASPLFLQQMRGVVLEEFHKLEGSILLEGALHFTEAMAQRCGVTVTSTNIITVFTHGLEQFQKLLDYRYPNERVPLLVEEEARVTTLEEEDLIDRLERFEFNPYPVPSAERMSELNAFGDNIAREIIAPAYRNFTAQNSIRGRDSDTTDKPQQKVLDRNKYNRK